MRLIIEGSQSLNIASREDLAMLVPPSFEGAVLNYGQGEGQFQVAGTVWGLYRDSSGNLYLQYEEGQCTWVEFQAIASAVIAQLPDQSGTEIVIKAEGSLEHLSPQEKYT